MFLFPTSFTYFANPHTGRFRSLGVTVVLFCSLLSSPLFLHAQTPAETWMPANEGLFGGTATSFGFPDNGSVLAGTTSGLFLLPAEESRWQKTTVEASVYDVKRIPSGAILAGTAQGIYRSTDNGRTWEHTSPLSGLTHFLPLPNNLLYATQSVWNGSIDDRYTDYYKSTDDGRTWSEYRVDNYRGNNGWIAATESGELLLATDASLLRSSDGGASWHEIAWETEGNRSHINRLVVQPSGGLLLATEQGIWQSNDQMTGWGKIDSLVVADIRQASNGEYLYRNAALQGVRSLQENGVHRTVNKNLGSHSRLLPGTLASALEVAPDGTLWLGIESSIMRSTDNGTTWERYDQGIGALEVAKVVAGSNGNLYTLVTTGSLPFATYSRKLYSLYRSTDRGESWAFLRDSLSTDIFVADDFGNLFVSQATSSWSSTSSEEGAGVDQSTDGGASWISRIPATHPSLGHSDGLSGLTYSRNGTIVIGTTYTTSLTAFGGGLIFSQDSGRTWHLLTGDAERRLSGQRPLAVATLPTGEIISTMWKGGQGEFNDIGLHRISRNGEASTLLSSTLIFPTLAASPDGVVLGFRNGNIYRSTDKGDSWNPVQAAEANGFLFGADGLAFASGTTLRSTDNGAVWAQMNLPPQVKTIASILFHPEGTTFGIADGGTWNKQVVRSDDNGETWHLFSNGLPTEEATSIALANGTLFCGTQRHGIYRLENTSNVEEGTESMGEARLQVLESGSGELTLLFRTDSPGTTSLTLFDLRGTPISSPLDNQSIEAGEHRIPLSLSHLPTGTYLLILHGPDGTASAKVQRR